jgi:hypothetical protein
VSSTTSSPASSTPGPSQRPRGTNRSGPTSTSTRPTTGVARLRLRPHRAATPSASSPTRCKLTQQPEPGGKSGPTTAAEHAPRDLRRGRRQGRPLHHGLQPAQDPARVPARHDRLHGRPRQRAGRHHPRRREDGQRDVQLGRAQDRADHGRQLRRGELRHVRPRLRALHHPRLAQQVRRHGRRPGLGRARDDRRTQPANARARRSTPRPTKRSSKPSAPGTTSSRTSATGPRAGGGSTA